MDEDEDPSEGEDQCAVERTSREQPNLQDIFSRRREREIQELARNTITGRHSDDDMAQLIINELDLRAASIDAIENRDVNEAADHEQEATSPVISTQHSYPPINQTGQIRDHDRPFAKYGHLARQTIAEQCDFNLKPHPRQPPPKRYRGKFFAVVSSTHVPKEDFMAHIKDQFGIYKIQYICIGEENREFRQQPYLLVQIIFTDQIDRRKPFLDEFAGKPCNYQVTNNELAWNEYIKKGGSFGEFGEFKPMKKRSQSQWPSTTVSSAAVAGARPSQPMSSSISTVAPARTTTVRAEAQERRKREDEIARQALALAEDSVDKALDFIRKVMPSKFMRHMKW